VEGAHTWDIQGRGIESKLITDLANRGVIDKLHQLR